MSTKNFNKDILAVPTIHSTLLVACICIQFAMTVGMLSLEGEGITGNWFQLHGFGLLALLTMFKLKQKRGLGSLLSLGCSLYKVARKAITIIC